MDFSLVAGSGGHSPAVLGLLLAVTSLVAEHGLWVGGLSSCSSRAPEHRLGSCGTWALLLQDMWDLPGSGIEPESPAWTGGFLTTKPPGKPYTCYFLSSIFSRFQKVLNALTVENLENEEDIKKKFKGFSGDPVVKTQCFYSCGPRAARCLGS